MVYIATDGTQFEDRNEWRKYEFETNYTFKEKSGERLAKLPGQIDGQPFDLADLEGCEVLLLDHSDQIQIDNLTQCKIFIGPCAESVFVRNCEDCEITIACKQLRTRDCMNCDIYLYSLTDPIIETSTNMRFAPFNGGYNGIRKHFATARLDPENNHWVRVYDFNDAEKSGKNWRIMDPKEESDPWIIPLDSVIPDVASLGPCENPVRRDAKAIIMDDFSGSSGGVKSFSFDTSQIQAEDIIESHQEPPIEQNVFSPPPILKEKKSFEAPPSPQIMTPASVKTFHEAPPTSDPFAAPKSNPMPSPPQSNRMDSLDIDNNASWPKYDAFLVDFESKLKEKQNKETKLKKTVMRKAEEDLDKYYGERTDRLANRAAANREKEQEEIKRLKYLKEKAADQPWARVVDLITISSKTEKKSSDNDKADDGNDTTRMRSVLVQLKNSGGLEVSRA